MDKNEKFYIYSGHVESPQRIKRIFAKFKESGLLYRCKLLPVILSFDDTVMTTLQLIYGRPME